jgi:hypothetical protein
VADLDGDNVKGGAGFLEGIKNIEVVHKYNFFPETFSSHIVLQEKFIHYLLQ